MSRSSVRVRQLAPQNRSPTVNGFLLCFEVEADILLKRNSAEQVAATTRSPIWLGIIVRVGPMKAMAVTATMMQTSKVSWTYPEFSPEESDCKQQPQSWSQNNQSFVSPAIPNKRKRVSGG